MKLNMTSRMEIPNYLNELGYTGVGAEVGVLRGEFARNMLQKWKGSKLFMIDSWNQNSNIDINNGDHIVQLNNLVETFKNVYEFKGRTCIIRDSSMEAVKMFKDGELDFVYIDAGHDYKSVREDIDAWWPKIKPGGMILGDDYMDGVLLWEGMTIFEVKRAVDTWAAEIGKEVMYLEHPGTISQWFVKK